MKKVTCLLILCSVCSVVRGGPVPAFATIFMRTVLDDATAAAARATLQIILTEFNPLIFAELSANPTRPGAGKTIIWMSDGTGEGDDGDLMIAASAGGVTRIDTLWDFSAAAVWMGESVIYAGENVIFAGEQVVYP